MEKIRDLNGYQKGVLLFMAAMALVFSVVYPITIARVGFLYQDALLVPRQENGGTVYAGKIQGQPARFTVSEGKIAVFQYGDKTYGPYTAREDPAAIPQDAALAKNMTGVELRQGDEILFRGGMLEDEDSYCFWLLNEDGTLGDWIMTHAVSEQGDGIERDAKGNIIDPMAPSAADILELLYGPRLTHKGEWYAWFLAMFVCVLNALSVLFADALFRWKLAFRVRNIEDVEPSDWEITGRYIGWGALSLVALSIFLTGLR